MAASVTITMCREEQDIVLPTQWVEICKNANLDKHLLQLFISAFSSR